jgi:hypothetical protein
MDYTEKNIDLDLLLDNYKNPLEFKEKVESLKQQLPSILEDFKKYYIFYNKNPEYPEYQQMFENIKSNLNKISSQLFVLSNEVETGTDDLNQKLFALDILINIEKKKNRELKKKLGIIGHKNNATSEMIDNYEEIYESQYLRNWALFFSIIFAGLTIKNVYTK